MEKYIEKHIAVDTLDGDVDLHHKSLYNSNPKVGTVAHMVSDKNYVDFDSGYATPYPVFGEVIDDRVGQQELTTFDVFASPENGNTKQEAILEALESLDTTGMSAEEALESIRLLSNLTSFKWDHKEFMHTRQAITMDVINPTSQSYALFGSVGDFMKTANFDSTTYSLTTRSLSLYEAIKLSKEKVIVTERNGTLVAILDANDIPSDIDGFLKFDLHEYTETTSTKMATVTFNMGQKNQDNFVMVPVNASIMIDYIVDDFDSSDDVYFHEFNGEIPAYIDDAIILKGNKTVLNRTSKGMMVDYSDGSTKYVQPFGLGSGDNVTRITFLKDYTLFLGSDDKTTEASSLFGLSILSFEDGSFLSATDTRDRYSVRNGVSARTRYNSSGLDSIYGYFLADGGFLPQNNEALVDTEIESITGNIFATILRNGDSQIITYQQDEDLYARLPEDVNFTRVNFINETREVRGSNVSGLFGSFGGQLFIQQNESMLGQVFRNKNFLYEVDYAVVDGVLSDEPKYGYAFPVNFFRVKRLKGGCSVGSDFPFASYDNVNSSENRYDVGNISRIMSVDDGQISVINAIDSLDDIIDTRYKAIFSIGFDNPALIQDFGFISYTKGARRSHPEENWLSRLMRDSDNEASRMSYGGTSDTEDPGYGMFWVRVKDTNTGTEKLISIREYQVDYRVTTSTYGWMTQKLECDRSLETVSPKLGRYGNPNMLHMRVFEIENKQISSDGQDVAFESFGNMKSAYSQGDGILSDLSRSINTVPFGINAFGMYFVNHQANSKFTDTVFLSGGPQKHEPLHKQGELFFYTIPDTGLIHASTTDYEWFTGTVETSEIKDINKRGIRYTDGSVTVDCYLEFNPSTSELHAKYVATSVDEHGISFSKSIEMPEWFSGTVYESDKDDIYPRRKNPYASSEDEYVVDNIAQLKSIPVMLTNRLFKTYGHTQCVIACWDESVNSILLPEAVTIREEESTVGSELIIEKSGMVPTYVYDIVPIVNRYDGNNPYIMSEDIILKLFDFGLVETTNWREGYNDAIQLELDEGNEESADLLIMKMFGENFSKDTSNTTITIAPVHYMQQDPWKHMNDYTTVLDKMMLSEKLKFVIPKGHRLITTIGSGVRNEITMSHEMKLFDENYYKVDGVVSRELLSEGDESEYIDTDHAYVLNYRNFYSGMFFMNRSIVADMDKYPNRRSYQDNNLLRELASPIREDAHHKKMDGRSVVAKWDVRYITDSLHTYSELVYELPTAFTCDVLPEEAILSRDHDNYHGFYKNSLTTISGRGLLHMGGSITGSFSNTSDEEQVVTLSYLNKNFAEGSVSYSVDRPLFMYEKEKLWPPFEYNGKRNRTKTGVKLVGTTVIGV